MASLLTVGKSSGAYDEETTEEKKGKLQAQNKHTHTIQWITRRPRWRGAPHELRLYNRMRRSSSGSCRNGFSGRQVEVNAVKIVDIGSGTRDVPYGVKNIHKKQKMMPDSWACHFVQWSGSGQGKTAVKKLKFIRDSGGGGETSTPRLTLVCVWSWFVTSRSCHFSLPSERP